MAVDASLKIIIYFAIYKEAIQFLAGTAM